MQARFVAVFTIHTRRPCDPDNVVTKWYTDGLRALGIIPDDTAELLETRIATVAAGRGQAERTVIEIFDRGAVDSAKPKPNDPNPMMTHCTMCGWQAEHDPETPDGLACPVCGAPTMAPASQGEEARS